MSSFSNLMIGKRKPMKRKSRSKWLKISSLKPKIRFSKILSISQAQWAEEIVNQTATWKYLQTIDKLNKTGLKSHHLGMVRWLQVMEYLHQTMLHPRQALRLLHQVTEKKNLVVRIKLLQNLSLRRNSKEMIRRRSQNRLLKNRPSKRMLKEKSTPICSGRCIRNMRLLRKR